MPAGILAVQLMDVLARLLVSVTAAVLLPEQMVCACTEKLTTGAGFTTILKLTTDPVQVNPPDVKLGVTVNGAVIGVVPLLTAVNAGMVFVPDAGMSPIVPVVLQV